MKLIGIPPVLPVTTKGRARCNGACLRGLLAVVVILGLIAGNVMAQSPSDGLTDISFNVGTGPDNVVTSVSAQTDGKAVIGGSFTTVDGVSRNGVARLTATGTLDTTFNVGTGTTGQVNFVKVLPAGKVLVGGLFSMFNGFARNNLVLLTSTGAVDATFNPPIVSGFAVAASVAAVDKNNKILVVANSDATTGNAVLERLGTNGSVDTTFSNGSGLNGTVLAMAVQSDGKYLIAGSFSTVNGITRGGIARLDINGTVDTTFTVGTGVDGPITAMALQSDGKILVGGTFNAFNGVARYGLARLNTDGSLDTSFAPTSALDSILSINSLLVEADGNILVGGSFSSIDDFIAFNIARLNPDGTLEYDFVSNNETAGGPNGAVESMVIPPTGQLLIAGAFTAVNGTGSNFVARLIDTVTHPAFFTGEVPLSNGVFYLSFYNGNHFGYYSYLTDPRYIYSFDLGYEYLIDANDGYDGIYMYDFASKGFFYTSPYFPFPYLYDFSANSTVYFYQDRPSGSPRYFYDFASGQYLQK